MKNQYKKILSSFDSPELPEGFAEKIVTTIVRREQKMLWVKIIASAMAFSGSMAVVVMGYFSIVSTLSQTGFFSIISLVFSDFSAMAANFPEFSFSLMESFPVFASALFLSGIAIAIWSMAALIDETALVRMHALS